MIISHKYKFIFVKTGKTAGTSIEVFLSSLCGELDVVTPVFPEVKGHMPRNYRGLVNVVDEITYRKGRRFRAVAKVLFQGLRFYNHMPAWIIKKRVPGNIWNSYYKFCVERHPYEKTLSHFSMLKNRSGGSLTVDDYFEKKLFQNDFESYTGENGELLVDRVVRYENLSEELGEIFETLKIPYDGKLNVHAKKGGAESRLSVSDVFSAPQLAQIREVFSPEIKLMGYKV